MVQPARLGRFARLYGGVALGRSSHVQRHGRVGKGYGQGVSVQQQVVQMAVLQGFLYRAVSGRGRVLALPRIVPQAQHRARCNIDRAACQRFAAGLAQLQKVEQLLADLHRLLPGAGVDVVQVHHAVIVVVDIKQPMIMH